MLKKILIVLALLLVGYEIHAQTQRRFEKLSHEKHDAYHTFESFHDRETGQEFICVYSGVDLGASVSCFLTGRKWQ